MEQRVLFFYSTKFYWHDMVRKTGIDPKVKMNEKIQKYRDEGFQVCWLFFACSGDPYLPNIEGQNEPVLMIKSEDMIISSGRTVEEIVCGKYPDKDFIIERLGLQSDFSIIVLGGFHNDDCVRRLEKYLNDVPEMFLCKIDTDLTDKAFI